MEQKFKTGDIVQLKSGGVSMTVDSYNKEDRKYTCRWFQVSNMIMGNVTTKRNQLTHDYFHGDMLEKVE
jgi:uncharacterized protein YodC (DUF2158 family)